MAQKVKKDLLKDIQARDSIIYDMLESCKEINLNIDQDTLILMCRSIQESFLNHLKEKEDLPEIVYNSDKNSCLKVANIQTLNYEIKDRLINDYGEITEETQKKIDQLDKEIYLNF